MLDLNDFTAADLATVLSYFGSDVDLPFLERVHQFCKRTLPFAELDFASAVVRGRALFLRPVLNVGELRTQRGGSGRN